MNKTIFIIAISFLCCQRIAELLVARANEKWMRQNRAEEFGREQYRWIVLLHGGFILSLIVEGWIAGPSMIAGWQIVAVLLGILQVLRYWCIISLGKFWNTKILVIPGKKMVRNGPYRIFRHPNYGVVILELLLWPLLFSCWLTLFWVGLANGLALRIRIRQEERALSLLV
ncbi:MAG: isoprenylcysteine carboxyl methyltransferase family protein [bacterium]